VQIKGERELANANLAHEKGIHPYRITEGRY
jgi:hypothetical protein